MRKLTRREFIALGSLGVLGASSSAQAILGLGKSNKSPFTFVGINDLHVLDARSTGVVNRAMDQINADPRVRFSVVIGDIATDGKLGEINLVKKSLDRLERPYFVVPGNHDVDPRAANIYANYQRVFGPLSWVHEENGWTFIGFDSCEGAKSDVVVRQEQIEWLKDRLRRIKRDRPLALFCHHPFNPHTKQYRVKNADEILALFSEHNLRLFACGHWHGNQVEEQDGVLFTTTACCSATRDNFDNTPEEGYRLFHLEKDTITTEFVEVPA